jgi:NAD(P)-dependent dehydrogenase (short-subunit alcohol dehydrogenase family)
MTVDMSNKLSTGKHVLITGCSSGIGRACVFHLAARGYSVLAGVRKESDAAGFGGQDAIRAIVLDVTNAASIATAAQTVGEVAGENGLAGLVNNAGISVLGPVEFVPPDQWRRQMEVNLIGQIAVTQAMLPMLRRHAEQTGTARIVMIGSIGGRISHPINSPYCASKRALAAVSDALRLELREQNIQTSLIEPGAIQSEIWRKGLEAEAQIPPDAPERKYYGALIDGIRAAASKAATRAVPAQRVARVVERCLTSRRAPTRVLVGRDAKIGAALKALLPDRWLDALISRIVASR